MFDNPREDLCLIAPGLFLSSADAEKDKQLLDEKKVRCILQVGTGLRPSHPGCFKYMSIPLQDLDEADLVVHLPSCIEFIDRGRQAGGVLVHCAAGISRSASVVIAYLMSHLDMTLEEAKEAVRASRPWVNPNLGFLLQLQLFRDAGCSAEGWEPWNYSRLIQHRRSSPPRLWGRGDADEEEGEGAAAGCAVVWGATSCGVGAGVREEEGEPQRQQPLGANAVGDCELL